MGCSLRAQLSGRAALARRGSCGGALRRPAASRLRVRSACPKADANEAVTAELWRGARLRQTAPRPGQVAAGRPRPAHARGRACALASALNNVSNGRLRPAQRAQQTEGRHHAATAPTRTSQRPPRFTNAPGRRGVQRTSGDGAVLACRERLRGAGARPTRDALRGGSSRRPRVGACARARLKFSARLAVPHMAMLKRRRVSRQRRRALAPSDQRGRRACAAGGAVCADGWRGLPVMARTSRLYLVRRRPAALPLLTLRPFPRRRGAHRSSRWYAPVRTGRCERDGSHRSSNKPAPAGPNRFATGFQPVCGNPLLDTSGQEKTYPN